MHTVAVSRPRYSKGGSMARANEYVDRYTNLQCVENEHPFADNITWIGLYVHEQDEPDWRPDVGA